MLGRLRTCSLATRVTRTRESRMWHVGNGMWGQPRTTANAVVYKWKERKSTPLIPLRSSVQGINSRALTLAQLSILSACTPLVGSLGSWDPLSMEHVSMHHGMHRCSQVPRPPMAHARPSKHSTPDLDTQRSSACVSMDGGACSRDRARHMLQCFLLS